MIIRKFEEQVNRYPEKIAVKMQSSELTYNLLNRHANQIARSILREYNNELNTNEKRENDKQNIALLFEHGTDMIASMIGVLKACKIYIPFEPTYPEKRLVYMIQDLETELIVTNNRNYKLAERLITKTSRSIKIINIDMIEESLSSENINRNIDENRKAYILYTSGSTGKPKGVIQTHKNVVHFIKNYSIRLGITETDKLSLFSTFSHDAAIMDIYGTLLNGATLYPLNLKNSTNFSKLPQWLISEGITIWHSVPTVYRHFINTLSAEVKFPNIRFVVLGGENVIERDIYAFNEVFPNSTLVNLYGQSESSYNSSFFYDANTELESVTLGEPIEGVKILLLNDKGKKVRTLRIGEIVIASQCIAEGYWNDCEKTNKVFKFDSDLGPLYYTGDLGRLMEDGSIKYIGRKDFQMKIRGYRIEPGEVENKLLKHQSIKEATVIARHDKNDNTYLCAYFVSDKKLLISQLREVLLDELPDHMIPACFVQLDKMPLTMSGKIDRKVLPEPDLSVNTGFEYVPPRNEIEKRLQGFFKELLGLQKIGIYDNFFDLGGNSLSLIKFNQLIKEKFGKDIPVVDLFKYPTIEKFAEFLSSENNRKEQICVDRSKKIESGKNRLRTRINKRAN